LRAGAFNVAAEAFGEQDLAGAWCRVDGLETVRRHAPFVSARDPVREPEPSRPSDCNRRPPIRLGSSIARSLPLGTKTTDSLDANDSLSAQRCAVTIERNGETALIQTLTTEERIAVARDFVTQLLIVAFSL